MDKKNTIIPNNKDSNYNNWNKNFLIKIFVIFDIKIICKFIY